MGAAGELTLSIIARQGTDAPSNVARLHPPPEPTPVTQSPELALLIAIFSVLNHDQKTKVRSELRFAASAVKCPHLAGACALVGEG
jgi:hypothetical protein